MANRNQDAIRRAGNLHGGTSSRPQVAVLLYPPSPCVTVARRHGYVPLHGLRGPAAGRSREVVERALYGYSKTTICPP